jgi:hypothetical protein
VNAATIPAGTTLIVSTVSLITSQSVFGRSFEAKLAQNVSVKGHILLKAGSKAFERSPPHELIHVNQNHSVWNSLRFK